MPSTQPRSLQTRPEFERKYGLTPRIEHHQIMKRDFLSYIFSGNLWPYGTSPQRASRVSR
jgi:hypothetical protein